MKQSFEIPGKLAGLNEYTSACRTSSKLGGACKRDNQNVVCWSIKKARLKPVKGKVNVHCTWIEPNMRRDKDNIRFGIKFILDALVEMGVIKNDNWTYINELSDTYRVNQSRPRIIVELEEV